MMPLTARAVRNTKIPRDPRSSCSYSVSSPGWPWFIISSVIFSYSFVVTNISSVMRLFQKSHGLRRVHGQQGTRFQIVQEVSQPQTADTGKNREMQHTDVKCGMQRRFHVPIDVDHAHQ